MRVISIATQTHGRVLVRDASAASAPARLLVGFHGYAQSAEDMMSELERIPGAGDWMLVAVQALHRFYSRGHERAVASWMTRQDRDVAIADNIAYVDRVIADVLGDAQHRPIVFAGFSQGVAMAYRAAVAGAHRARYVIAVGGDVPPDVKSAPADRFPPVLIAAGASDDRYPEAQVDADAQCLRSIGARIEVFRYSGGHEWTAELRNRIHQALAELT